MTLWPSVNSASVEILVSIAQDGISRTAAAQRSHLFGCIAESKQRIALAIVGDVANQRDRIDQHIDQHLRDPASPLPRQIHEIIAVGIVQLDRAALPPRLLVSSLVSLAGDLGYSHGLTGLVNAILVDYSVATNAQARADAIAAKRRELHTAEGSGPAADSLPQTARLRATAPDER